MDLWCNAVNEGMCGIGVFIERSANGAPKPETRNPRPET